MSSNGGHSGQTPRGQAPRGHSPAAAVQSGITSASYRNNEVRSVMLYGVPIIALVMDSQERLCLAQISNTLLKNFSYNEIHNRYGIGLVINNTIIWCCHSMDSIWLFAYSLSWELTYTQRNIFWDVFTHNSLVYSVDSDEWESVAVIRCQSCHLFGALTEIDIETETDTYWVLSLSLIIYRLEKLN